MTKKEFYEKHCKWCGTQRCPGAFADDPDWYEGCPDYRKEILGENYTTLIHELPTYDIGAAKFKYPESFGNLVEPLSLEEAHCAYGSGKNDFNEFHVGDERSARKKVIISCDEIILQNNSLSLEFQLNNDVLKRCEHIELNGIKFVREKNSDE